MRLYDESVTGKEIILLDDIFGQTAVYHIPIIKVWQDPFPEKWEGKAPPFFRAGEGGCSMVGRLDFVESILRRDQYRGEHDPEGGMGGNGEQL